MPISQYVFRRRHQKGFTLIELLVTLAIIGILTAILYANFEQARQQTRDKSRMAALKEAQLAIEQYRAQNGRYPVTGCGNVAGSFAGPGPRSLAGFDDCSGPEAVHYIGGSAQTLIPDYLKTLPLDPKFEYVSDKGFYYRSDGISYKLMLYDVAESIFITSFSDEYARCPSAIGACSSGVPATTYAVYSIGAEGW